MDYQTIKWVHQAAVALSVSGLFIRGVASGTGAPWVQSRAAKTLPLVLDTVLLISALVLYVPLGVLTLRPGRSPAIRLTAWVAALVMVGWITSVALTKSPWRLFG